MSNMEMVLKNVKLKESPEEDIVKKRIFKRCSVEFQRMPSEVLINMILSEGRIPPEFKDTLFIP